MEHRHDHPSSGHTLFLALCLTLTFAVIEAVAGWMSGSLALLGDAGHMITDASALGLAAFAAWLMGRPPSRRHSYGLVRAEVIAALINGLVMLAIVIGLVIAAVERLQHPQPVASSTVIVVALIGLFINLAVVWVLHRGEQTLNIRGALLHVMGDLLGSIGALVAGITIHYTDWYLIDPILSLAISLLILISALRLLRECVHIIMEGVPLDMNLDDVEQVMRDVDGVISVHDLHVWTLTTGQVALSAHVAVEDIGRWQEVLERLENVLHDRFDMHETTLQPEPSDAQAQARLNCCTPHRH